MFSDIEIKNSIIKNDNEIESKETRILHYHEIKHCDLSSKIYLARKRIEEFFKWAVVQEINELTISYSGGKDSTVLLDLVISVHKELKLKIFLVPIYATEITFSSTIPFIKNVIRNYQKNFKYLKDVDIKYALMPWTKILNEKGFPIYSKQFSTLLNRLKRCKTPNKISRMAFGISETIYFKITKKRLFLLDDDLMTDENGFTRFFGEKCCTYVKGGVKKDKRPSFIGVMASESKLRYKSWINSGCNVFNSNKQMSRPLSIWNSDDIWNYIEEYKLLINPAYGYNPEVEVQNLRFERLGCSACPFGSSIEELIHRRKYKDKADEWKFDDDNKIKNRFEKLKDYSPLLYESQVWNTNMYLILIDMKVKIRNDLKYQKLYKEREIEIANWYSKENFKNNLLKILISVENSENNNGWKYELSEINIALKFYDENPISRKELEIQRKKWKAKRLAKKVIV